MRYLVTGATGFIGSFLVRRLIAQGHEVHAIVRKLDTQACWRISDILNDLRLIEADLNDHNPLVDLLHGLRFDVICHTAWSGVNTEARNSPSQILQNVSSALDMLSLCKHSGCPVFVGLGSQAEYGIAEGVLDEFSPCNPVTAYGVAKHTLSMLATKVGEVTNIRVLWLRVFSLYGPKDDPKHLVPYLIQSLLSGTSPRLSPGGQVWDYLYVEDAVEAIVSAITSHHARGIYNLGSGQAISLREVIELTRDLINPDLPLHFGQLPYRADQVMHLEANIDRLQQATGWQPKTSLKEGLARTIECSKQSAPYTVV